MKDEMKDETKERFSAMKKSVLIVIDMQTDFIDGALGTKEAEGIVTDVAREIENFSGDVIFTRDTHGDNYLQTQEGKLLPVTHCVKNTDGWQLHPRLQDLAKGKTIIDKPTFGSLTLPQYLKSQGAPDTIVLMGLCTDICVISNALILKAAFPEAEIFVDSRCCAGTTIENHENALKAMKMCQILVL